MASAPIFKIGKYQVIDVIGEGGMGIVYKAVDPLIGRTVAIKKITANLSGTSDIAQRFRLEARAAGSLQHPNIVVIYEFGEEAGAPYLVMEHLAGNSLTKIIASRQPLTVAEKLGIIIQVCNALDHAHRHGIIHRDVKPANVIVQEDGLVKLLDFGLAHGVDKALTRTGQIMGTINYIAPEQLNGLSADVRSDIFSTGVMLYELLTYKLPFDAPQMAAIITKILNEPAPHLAASLIECPPELDGIVARALSKRPEDRYATAEGLAFDLSQVQQELNRDLVAGYVEEARSSLARSDLQGARDLLARVLKIDTQHPTAKLMMQEIQQVLQRQQTAQKITECRTKAEAALEAKQYQEALEYIDEGLRLDRTDTELLSLRERILQARSRKEKLSKLLHLAETAQHAGELEMAQRVLDEAVQLAPDDTQVKLLHASVVRLVAEHARKEQLRKVCEQLHRQVSAGQFTAAYELVKQAEAVDANDPEVQSLKETIGRGYEQELRRRQVQAICREIEDALLRDDATTACATVASAIRKFPRQPELFKLKAIAEAKRDAHERKVAVEKVMESVHALSAMGKTDEALQEIEKADRRFPGEPQVRSLLESLRQDVQRQMREKLEAEYLNKSAEAAAAGDFELALRTLEAGRLVLPDSTQIAAALQVALATAEERAKQKKIELVTTKVQRLLQEHEHERAISILERATTEFTDPSLERLLGSARSEAQEFSTAVAAAVANARRLLEQGHFEEALAFVLSQPDAYCRVLEFADVAAECRRRHEQKPAPVAPTPVLDPMTPTSTIAAGAAPTAAPLIKAEPTEGGPAPRPLSVTSSFEPQPFFATTPSPAMAGSTVAETQPALEQQLPEVFERRPQAVTPTPETPTAEAPSRQTFAALSSARIKLAAALVVAVAVLVGGWFVLHRGRATGASGYIEVDAQPWAIVRTVETKAGKAITVNQPTPLRVTLPAGEYAIVLVGPAGTVDTGHVSVTPGQVTSYKHDFEVVDVKKIVDSY